MAGGAQVVLLTPPGRAAVATILVAGPNSLDYVARRFQPASRKPLVEQPLGRIAFGRWPSGDASEEVVVCRRSATEVEIHCHGGRAASRAILDALVSDGCEETDWKTWLRQSTADLLAAEVRIALAEAPTQRTAALLLRQATVLREAFVALDREIAAGEVQAAAQRVDCLLAASSIGLHLRRPWRVVLAGSPNVGKSSLINALVGYQRAIVHSTPGTTRDLVSVQTALDGWPIELIDTAGLRTGGQDLEVAGMQLARQQAASADLVIRVLDRSRPGTDEDAELASAWPRSMVVLNKCDLPDVCQHSGPAVEVSATEGSGLEQLIAEIVARLVPGDIAADARLPFLDSHVAILRAVNEALKAGDLQRARTALANYVGR